MVLVGTFARMERLILRQRVKKDCTGWEMKVETGRIVVGGLGLLYREKDRERVEQQLEAVSAG